MVEIKIAVMIMCAGLKFWGEQSNHNAQRYIMPLIIAIAISYISQVWWLGIPSLLMITDTVEGYGFKSWMRKLLGDAGAQGMWMFSVCVLSSLLPAILGHVSLWIYIPWCILAGVLGATTRALNNKIWSLIKGLWIGGIVFFVR